MQKNSLKRGRSSRSTKDLQIFPFYPNNSHASKNVLNKSSMTASMSKIPRIEQTKLSYVHNDKLAKYNYNKL